MNYVSVDNGISGALALISEMGPIVSMTPMPIQRTRKGNEVNVREVTCWVRNLNVTPVNTVVAIEEPGGSKSAKAATSMAGSFHALRALFELAGFRVLRLTPQAWQKPLLKCKAGDTKLVALQLAKSLWPDESFLATPRCKVPHDGLIDACLLGEHCRRNKL